MILLIGGTSETAPLAAGLAGAGYEVLVSTATDTPLAISADPRISRRTGRLDEEGLVALGKERGIRAIADAAHPDAVAVHAAAPSAARRLGIPCLVFRRPERLPPESAPGSGPPPSGDTAPADLEKGDIRIVGDHDEAAAAAFSRGRPVFLTTGSRNLAPYAAEARRTGIPLIVRVLDAPESLAACRKAGLPEGSVITGRGPFSVEENLAAIRRFGIGVLVTKESGTAGGIEAKLAAGCQTNCGIIVIRRPSPRNDELAFDRPSALIAALRDLVSA